MTEQTADRSVLATLSNDLAAAVARAGRSVVTVSARGSGPSSGVVWDGEGTVVTAAHAIERSADIHVSYEGTTAAGVLVGRDPGSDVAVVRVAAAGLTPADGAPTAVVLVGSLVLAVGRSDPASPMASFGVASAVGGAWRTRHGDAVDGYIRTDVALLPGMSGGPLVDAQGRVLGMVSSSLGRGGAVALPTAAVARIVARLQSGQSQRRAYLGVGTQVVEIQATLRQRLQDTGETGLMVLSVEPGAAAERGGLLVGDILLALADRRLTDGEALLMALGPAAVGRPARVRALRGGAVVELTVVPTERPRE